MIMDDNLQHLLLETFSQELEDIAIVFNQQILLLEKLLAEKKPNAEALENCFKELLRLAHNIKGSSRAIGLNDISELSHQLENAFAKIKEDHAALSKESMNLLLHTIDAMLAITKARFHGQSVSENPESLLAALNQFLNTSTQEKSALKPKTDESVSLKDQHGAESVDSIRVSTKKLDHISVTADALSLNLQQLQNHLLQMTKEVESHHSAALLRTVVKTMARHLEALQYETKLLRLVPAAFLLHQMPRIVRDLSQELKKNVELEITGDHIEVDRKVLEALHDPFIHLLRNAIDHGIESPLKRKQHNKSETGKISIHVESRGEKILFEMVDDGGGIDKAAIIEAAIKRHLINPEAAEKLSDQDVLALILTPGFSSKPMITSVSGRGVGLDVVQNHIQRVNGSVSITSTPQHGTTIAMLVPLTIATDRGLIIKNNNQLFAIPTMAIDRIVTVSQNDLLELEGNLAIVIGEKSIPLRALSSILYPNKPLSTLADSVTIIIMSRSGCQLGVIVDDVLGESTLVIKPLSAPLSHTPCVSGATIYHSGEIALILNPNDLMKLVGLSEKLLSQHHAHQTQKEVKKQILVVDDSITTRTLEKNILEARGFVVVTAVDGEEALSILKKQSFDLIVTDILMPRMDGLTLTHTLKQDEKYKYIPIIIVTTLGSDEEKQKGLDAGADAYLIKHEFQSQILIDIVNQLL